MDFNKHLDLEGEHAFLGASKSSWLNYDDEKVKSSYLNHFALQRGIELHDFARRCIELGQKLPKSSKTLNSYVNDAIGYRMTPELVLYYSPNCFGTADAISFEKNVLRIHDLKTGVTRAHMEQLEIYSALFCLEYGKEPNDISFKLRIYQNQQIIEHEPTPDSIADIMKKIIRFDSIIEEVKGTLK